MRFRNKNLFIYLPLLVSLIYTQQVVTFTEAEINAGDSANIQLLLTNDQPVSGFQFQIVDLPDQGYFSNVLPTDRTESFMVNFNEQPDGSLIAIGFSLTGEAINPGDGAILNLAYQSTGEYSSSLYSIIFFDIIFGEER